MELRVGDWFLCESYIDEPVQIRTVDNGRIEVRYLTSGKLKWLGYPKIWRACKPHALPHEPSHDPVSGTISLDDGRSYSLSQLRAAFLPESAKPRPKPAPEPAPYLWTPDPEWQETADAADTDASDDYEYESED